MFFLFSEIVNMRRHDQIMLIRYELVMISLRYIYIYIYIIVFLLMNISFKRIYIVYTYITSNFRFINVFSTKFITDCWGDLC